MTPFFTTSKAVGSKILQKRGAGQLVKYVNSSGAGNSRKYIPIRYLSSIASIDRYSWNRVIYPSVDFFDSPGHVRNNHTQRRHFLGCGDGEEGSALAKVYEEKRVIGYSPEQLYAVVAAVDLYEDFLPWCQRSDVVQHHPDGSFDAELEIGFKFLVESYLSHVVLNKPRSIKTTSSQSNLFEHLINVWEFNPGPTPETCNLYFLVDFKFRSPLYRQVASMFFREVVSRLVGSFNDRCRLIYGPSAPILEPYN